MIFFISSTGRHMAPNCTRTGRNVSSVKHIVSEQKLQQIYKAKPTQEKRDVIKICHATQEQDLQSLTTHVIRTQLKHKIHTSIHQWVFAL
jgi:hypothetical protein